MSPARRPEKRDIRGETHGRHRHARACRLSRRSAGLAGDNLPGVAEGPRGHHGEPQRRDRRARLPRLEAGDGRQGLGRSDLAQGLWRRRAFEGRGPGSLAGDGEDRGLQPDRRHGRDDVRADAAGIRHRGPEAALHAGHRQRHDALVPGLLGAGRGVRPRLAGDALRGQGRPLSGERAEDLDLGRSVRRLDLLSGAHRHDAQARGHLVPGVRHEVAGRRGAADPAHLGQLALLRNLLHRREGAEGSTGRAAERRLVDRQAAAAVRTPEPVGRGRRHRGRHGPFRRAGP